MKVLGGSITIILGAILLGYASSLHTAYEAQRSAAGIIASLGASVVWGTMFLPYRKAYISGMNPLSFVTIFTVGELITMGSLALVFHGGMEPLIQDIVAARKAFFWLFLGGFCWVVGDLFANYAAKYVGIGRAAPLMNTNQLWGLAWGVLVFGEFAGQSGMAQAVTIGGSLIVVAGAAAISSAVAPEAEQASRRLATLRECERYGLDVERVEASMAGTDPLTDEAPGQRWWDGGDRCSGPGDFRLPGDGYGTPAFCVGSRVGCRLVHRHASNAFRRRLLALEANTVLLGWIPS